MSIDYPIVAALQALSTLAQTATGVTTVRHNLEPWMPPFAATELPLVTLTVGAADIAMEPVQGYSETYPVELAYVAQALPTQDNLSGVLAKLSLVTRALDVGHQLSGTATDCHVTGLLVGENCAVGAWARGARAFVSCAALALVIRIDEARD